jgi:hypothetical protein
MHIWDCGLTLFQVDTMTLSYAVHRLSGVVSPANAAYSASELEFQLKNSGATALFTVRIIQSKADCMIYLTSLSAFPYWKLPCKQ